jgi:hypothetical protein
VDLGREASLLIAIVPFEQITIDNAHSPEAGLFASPDRPLQRAHEHLGESESTKPLPQMAGIPLASLCQWQIREPGVPARQAPSGLTVPAGSLTLY